MPRSPFDEIRALHNEWASIKSGRYQSCLRLAFVICEGFRKYIGAPTNYEEFGAGPGQRKAARYTNLGSVEAISEGKSWLFEKVETPHDALCFDNNAIALVFGIALTVDFDPNTFPKTTLWYRIGVKFEKNECVIFVYDEEAARFPESEAENAGDAQLSSLYSKMYDFAKDVFRRDPWERPRANMPIGFLRREDAP